MFTRLFVQNPIFTNVIAIIAVILGIVSLTRLPIALYPDITPPTIAVSASYPGADAETVAKTVGAPIELQVNGVENMIYMSSTSADDGTYSLTVTFALGTDVNIAMVLLQNLVNNALPLLPEVVQQQGVTVTKHSPSILQVIALDSPGGSYDNLFLANYANLQIENVLSRVKGVGQVQAFGAGFYAMRIWLDLDKLNYLGVSVDEVKEDPLDFALWKAQKPGEPAWESPYGMGRPGWHIECSAMSRTHLGKTIDLHCGGQDLIFPHHENEIAQSECANGCTFSRYWMHNGFLNINNEKMSKSANNFFTVREIADKYGYEPIRYFMLTAGYRMPLNYTVELIESCKNSLERMYTCRDNLDFAIEHAHGTDTALVEKCEDARKKFKAAMDDDLNTPDALAAIFDLVKDINTLSDASDKATLETAAKTFDELTGVLGLLYNRKKTDSIPAEVTALVEERAAAKKAKDWGRADAIRAQLTEMGWSVTDTAQGPKLAKL